VLARNWRSRTGEIDLVARCGRLVVVCEVKSRAGTGFGTPAEAVTPAKQRRLRRLAAEWLAATGTRGVDVRFDVASIVGRTLEVVPGAF
jgi:putative endonuclease